MRESIKFRYKPLADPQIQQKTSVTGIVFEAIQYRRAAARGVTRFWAILLKSRPWSSQVACT